MSQVLMRCINYLFDNYAKAKNDPFEKHPIADYIRNTIPNDILNAGLIDPSIYKVDASPGKYGKWANVPWIRISRKSISNSAQEGVYIVYLFSADGDTVFLTLNQGYTDIEKDTKQQENSTKKAAITKLLRDRATHCINTLNGHSFNSDMNISLGKDPGNRGKMYELGSIFYKEYKKQAVPSEEILEKDLKDMLEIYEEYYEKIFKGNDNKKAPLNPIPNEKIMFQNRILFGAPGTGKSFKIDDPENGYGLKDVDVSRKFRTTFHPDYDYAQFVGAYKPKPVDTKAEKNEITYSFVPQVFAKAYATAWKQYIAAGNASTTDNQIYLVIEEINRGNCAQIFGDIFQLLDRDGKGFSQYSIDADCDFATWLKEDSILKTVWDDYETKVGEGKLKLPPNLIILATMNTSDQSLFPMDSAFKRRFDWEYMPISFDGKEAADYLIDIDGSRYSWQKFVETVNEKILTLTESEDKQLGEFFIKPDKKDENGECVLISCERFLGKVMFYLWNEVCKDEHKNDSFFRVKSDGKEEYFTFQDLYKKEKRDYLKRFMDELLKEEG